MLHMHSPKSHHLLKMHAGLRSWLFLKSYALSSKAWQVTCLRGNSSKGAHALLRVLVLAPNEILHWAGSGMP